MFCVHILHVIGFYEEFVERCRFLLNLTDMNVWERPGIGTPFFVIPLSIVLESRPFKVRILKCDIAQGTFVWDSVCIYVFWIVRHNKSSTGRSFCLFLPNPSPSSITRYTDVIPESVYTLETSVLTGSQQGSTPCRRSSSKGMYQIGDRFSQGTLRHNCDLSGLIEVT